MRSVRPNGPAAGRMPTASLSPALSSLLTGFSLPFSRYRRAFPYLMASTRHCGGGERSRHPDMRPREELAPLLVPTHDDERGGSRRPASVHPTFGSELLGLSAGTAAHDQPGAQQRDAAEQDRNRGEAGERELLVA